MTSATSASGSGRTGTGTTSPLTGSVISPSGVPKAIVNTGTPASAASWAPSSVGRPTVVSPSDSSTIAPGAMSSSVSALSPSSLSSASLVSRSAPVARASPIAVDSASSRPSMPASSDSRSSVGGTSTATLPLNEISPTSMSGATWSTNARAASLAASSRSGSTSVAIIDSETSNSTRIRPSLSVRSVVVVIGRAMATTPAARPSQLQHGDDVAPPAGAGRGDPVEQLDLGEAHRRPASPALDDDVGDAEGGDERAATTAAPG